MTDLKPCPFCGGKARITQLSVSTDVAYTFKSYKIQCPQCGCRINPNEEIIVKISYSPRKGAVVDETELNNAIEAWNRRADNG